MTEDQKIWKKIYSNSKVNPDNGCIEWTAGLASNGYSKIRYGIYTLSAHRLVWQLTFGELQTHEHVLHRCDNRKCINIAHLWVGSHTDNVRDMHSKGRNKPRTTKRSLDRFTEEQQAIIMNEGLTYKDRAAKLGVSVSTVFDFRQMYKAAGRPSNPPSKLELILQRKMAFKK